MPGVEDTTGPNYKCLRGTVRGTLESLHSLARLISNRQQFTFQTL